MLGLWCGEKVSAVCQRNGGERCKQANGDTNKGHNGREWEIPAK